MKTILIRFGWILLGLTLATHARAADATPAAVPASPAAPAARPQLTGKPGSRDAWYFNAFSAAKDLVSPEQTAEEQAQADADWAHLFDPVDGRSLEYVGPDGQPSNVMLGDAQRRVGNYQREPREYVWSERAKRALRDRGLKFWDDHPKDVRRLVWLYVTNHTEPFYWSDEEAGSKAFVEWLADRSSRTYANLPRDWPALAKWQTRLVALRAEFMNSALVGPLAKAVFERAEFERRFFADLQRNKIPDSVTEPEIVLRWTKLLSDYLGFAARYPTESVLGYTPSVIVQMLEENEKIAPEWFAPLKKDFLAAARNSASNDLREYAYVTDAQPVDLEIGQPVPGLKFTTLKNQGADRSVWHGKVVLIDFWAFWCHSCIESMPHLKVLYDKYHSQGFEIYGVCFAEKNETPQKIVDLMKKMDIPWDQARRDSLQKDIFSRLYSFTSLPQLLLLDKNGNLAARNVYNYADLETKIQELLKQKYPQ